MTATPRPAHKGQENKNDVQGNIMMLHRRQFAGAIAILFAILSLTTASIAAPAPKKITVGSVTLKFCNGDYAGYCGTIQRKLDPTGGFPGNITVGFEWYPRFDQSKPALGVFLPQEGGPGYSSTGTRDAYLNILGTLRD
ncbi:MAG: hypothetical protein ACRET4_07780, partial [Steroidobacteraceae bacterium]